MGSETSKEDNTGTGTGTGTQLGLFMEDAIRALTEMDISQLEDRSVMRGHFIARVIDMYDGDTLTAAIINECGKKEKIKVRVFGCDTPELKGITSEAGHRAKNEALIYLGAREAQNITNGIKLSNWFEHNIIFVELEFKSEREKYGRFLADVRSVSGVGRTANPVTLSNHLIDKGHARKYMGGTKNQEEFQNVPAAQYEQTRQSAASIEYRESDLRATLGQVLYKAYISDGYKGENAIECAFVKEVWDIIIKHAESFCDDYAVLLDRKKIVHTFRKSTNLQASAFVGALSRV